MAICDVIKYEGDNNTLVYKFPEEDFNTLSQLIVHESQEAILFKNGQMCDSFGQGKYTLHTGNIPLLNKLVNLPTGGESPFHCEVYFVNKALALDYKWGTSSQARVMDRTYNLILNIGASGIIGIHLIDPRKLTVKIVGTTSSLTADQCIRYFRENISARVKQYIVKAMQHPGMDFLTLDSNLLEFSSAVKAQLETEFEDIGVGIYNFVISAIKIPDEEFEVITAGQRRMQQEQYDLRSAQFAKQRRIIEAEGEAAFRGIQGYNWADEQKAEIAKTYAANEGAQNSPTGMFAQAPAALMFGNMLKNNMEPLLNPDFSQQPFAFGNGSASTSADVTMNGFGATPADDIVPVLNMDFSPNTTQAGASCPNCGVELAAGSNFCSKCGASLSANNRCPNCGAELQSDDVFCSKCGTKRE